MSLAKPYRDIISHVNQNVIGQPAAIEQLARALKIAEAGLQDPDRPLAVLLFAGPTGTGKSEAVRALAEAIHDDPKWVCRIDCNLLTESHTASSLTGSPPGYIGSTKGSSLLEKVIIEGQAGRPGILVFEEIEKAHPVIFDTLLGIFDKGVLNMNNGRNQVIFSNTIIVLTSNAGARELSAAASGKRLGFVPAGIAAPVMSDEDRNQIVMRELTVLFRPEFLNRLDDVVVFRWLEPPDLSIIVSKFIAQLGERLMNVPHFLEVSQSGKDFLVAHGTDVANGARPLKRAIRRYLEEPLAEMLADGVPHDNVRFYVSHRKGADELTITYTSVFVVKIIRPALTLASPERAIAEPEIEIADEIDEEPDD